MNLLISVAIGAMIGVTISHWLHEKYEPQIYKFLNNTLGRLLDKLGL